MSYSSINKTHLEIIKNMLSKMPKQISKELSKIQESIKKRTTHKPFQRSKQNSGPEPMRQKKERNTFTSQQTQNELKQKLVYMDIPSPEFTLSPLKTNFSSLLAELKHRNQIYSVVQPYLSQAEDPALQLEQIFRTSNTLKKIIAQLRKNIGRQQSSIEQMRNWIKQQNDS